MSLDQLKGFLRQTGDDPALRQAVQADATAADLAAGARVRAATLVDLADAT